MKSKGLKYAPMMVFQIILMVLYFVFVEYETTAGAPGGNIQGFGDTHVMIFIGFGFLMTFLKKYCYSALGFNLLLAALVIQWGLLCQNAFHMSGGKIIVTKTLLLEADVMAATVLITFGALLGYTSDLQLLFIAIVETAVGCVNFWIVADKIQAADVGGSIAIHAYGAYFGLGVSLALKRRAAQAQDGQVAADNGQAHSLNAPTYVSDVTAMIGSIFLWIYWPSFNSALTESVLEHQRAVVNTYLSLASATVTSFFLSVALTHEHKLDMVHIQNSPLAGGVGVGSICNMFIGAGGAIAVGIGAGIISVFGYVYLTPWLTKRGLLDTCGVNNLHGLPGVYSGLMSILFAFLATPTTYGGTGELYGVFPAMGNGRSAETQALYQFLALLCTIGIALVAGMITGCISKLSIFDPLKPEEKYSDERSWELPA